MESEIEAGSDDDQIDEEEKEVSLEEVKINCGFEGCEIQAIKKCEFRFPGYHGCKRLICGSHTSQSAKFEEYGDICVDCVNKIGKGLKAFLLFFIIFWAIIIALIILKFVFNIN